MTDIDKTLEEQGEVYGDYGENIAFRATLMDLIKRHYSAKTGKPMLEIDLQRFQDIVGKLARVAASPDHADSWHDIAGYAKLIEKEVLKNKK